MDESLDRVAGLVEECLKAGKRQNLHQGTPLPSVGRVPHFLIPLQIAPEAPVSQTNSRTTSVPNAVSGVPNTSQNMYGTFTNQAKNSGISSAQVSGVHV